MPNKINMAELLADRDYCRDNPMKVGIDDLHGQGQRRLSRLPDLEAAYIEAIEALEKCANAPHSRWTIAQAIARTTLEKINQG